MMFKAASERLFFIVPQRVGAGFAESAFSRVVMFLIHVRRAATNLFRKNFSRLRYFPCKFCARFSRQTL
jgi:hypothetical protein